MLFEITHRYSGEVLFSLETKTLKLCLEAAVKSGSDLRGSDLRYSKLRGSVLEDRPTVWQWANEAGLPMRTIKTRTLVMAWRTQDQPHMHGENYEIGKVYTAEPFSSCPVTSCHPGRYVDTKGDMAVAFWLDEALLAGPGTDAKVRCKRFRTLGTKDKDTCEEIFQNLTTADLNA